MGMSTHVVGIKPPDAKWKKMKAVWDACKSAGISVPDEVCEFFGNETPDPKGVVVELEKQGCVSKYNDADRTAAGFEVDVTKLPADVKIIRFSNSW